MRPKVVTMCLVMNQDTDPTKASSTTEPKTLQEQSCEIDQLAAAVANRPETLNRSHRFAMIHNGRPEWRFALPFPSRQWAGRFAIHQSGTLYVCEPISPEFDVHRWAIASQGLFRAIRQQPHTIGFGMMDAAMVAEHMQETLQDWLSCNFSADEAQAAVKILERNLRKTLPEWAEVIPADPHGVCVDRISNCITILDASAEMVRNSLKASPRTAIRCESVAMIRHGALQALMLSRSLLEQAAALCWDAENPPPEGSTEASSS